MKIKEALYWGKKELQGISSSAQLDAEVLLGFVLRQPLSFLLTHNEENLSPLKHWSYRRLIKKRKKGVPVAYITRHKEFYLLDFFVNENVLIPRPDTEILVEETIKFIKSRLSAVNCQLLDVGTGSGCIPIAVLKNIPDLRAIATDWSGAALKVAFKNAKKHGVNHRIQFVKSDLLELVYPFLIKNKPLIVTANLPYLPPGYAEKNSNLIYEPSIALYAEEKGLSLYFKLLHQLKSISPEAIFLECFDFQAEILKRALKGYVTSIRPMTGKAVGLIALKK